MQRGRKKIENNTRHKLTTHVSNDLIIQAKILALKSGKFHINSIIEQALTEFLQKPENILIMEA